MDVKLIVQDGLHKGRVLPLPQTMFVIGRSPRCHLRPHCEEVSKFHCAIARRASRILIRDLKSANGTFVNGQRVSGEIEVQHGDLLQVGKLTFLIQVGCQAEQPIQIVHEGDVQWLMEDPSDSAVLEVERTVKRRSPASVRGSGSLSAGEYLFQYFRDESRRGAENTVPLDHDDAANPESGTRKSSFDRKG